MSNTTRKIRKHIHKLTQELFRALTKPDDQCDLCSKEFSTSPADSSEKSSPTQDVVGNEKFEACYMTCPELCARNKVRNKDLIDKLRAVTGDAKI